MKPETKDHYICEMCGFEEIVFPGVFPKMMGVMVCGHEHPWCPDCIYFILPWRKHVNKDHLRVSKRKDIELTDANKSSSEHVETLGNEAENFSQPTLEILYSGDKEFFIVPSEPKKALK